MATCPIQYSVNDVPRTIIVTGAEDTTIRLFAYTPEIKDEKQGSFKCALTLRKHTTGLQHLQFSQCGRFLFSSGGLEETYVWRVRSIPGLGLGAVLEVQCPKSTPKSDLRVMTFDVLNLESEDDTASFLLALAYSNSEVKVFMYSTPTTGGQGTFTLVAQGHYKSNCLTQLKFVLSQPAISLLSASTDGHIALWSITEAVSPFLSFTQDSGLLKRPDDNHRESAETALISWHSSYMIHQNSIKALDLLVVDRDGTPGTPQSRRRAEDVIIVTGGDDNALAVTRISVGQGRDSYPHSVSYVSPDRSDHAAAINDVLLLRYTAATTSMSEAKKLELQFASSGNDQQLKVFNVTLGLADDGTLKAESKCLSDRYTAVADVASLGRVDPVATKTITDETGQATNSFGVLVCGVGMDMWSFD
ncbi:hypothetical protein KEM55_006542 [Ascosphaera atra]|nr:hypothetical protein KEM55_006542 [Ascosphaera atra]